MITLTRRGRTIVLIICLCLFIYAILQYINLPQLKDENIITRQNLVSHRIFSVKDTTENNGVYGIENFESRLPKIQHNFEEETVEEKNTRESRREAVKKSFLHGWNGYKMYALGADELKPLSNKPRNPFGGLGATMIDSLSTMLIMGLTDEVDQLIPLVEKIQVKVDEQLSVFETVIRCMGGLLSAYELSEHPRRHVFLKKAEEIGLALLPAFNTSYGLPYYKFNPVTEKSMEGFTYVADAATIQLEFLTLSYHTGNPIFAKTAQVVTDFLDNAGYAHGLHVPGLYPFKIDIVDGYFKNNMVSFGAMGDSAYEYFLKQYLLTDGQALQSARMYQQSIDSMKTHMLLQLPGSKLLYLPDYDTRRMHRGNTMDHLTCFVPGMLAMGSKIFNRPDDMLIAKGLLETCVHMYRSSSTNLSPEKWGTADQIIPYNALTYGKTKEELDHSRDWWFRLNNVARPQKIAKAPDIRNRTIDEMLNTPSGMITLDHKYVLRPETIESLYIMYRITGDPVYQEYGWIIYEALEENCKTESAYASLKNVGAFNSSVPLNNQMDSMETFLFAETFKYLYLLFSPPNIISLDKFVLNTEAHPLLRRPWTINF